MEWLSSWVTNIIVFILLTVILDLVLPSSNLKKYTKMVTGLLLISIILSPILSFLNSNPEDWDLNLPMEQSEEIKNSIEEQKKEIQASSRAYMLEQMAVQLTSAASEKLLDQHSLKITDIQVLAEDVNPLTVEHIESIAVTLVHDDAQVHEENSVQDVENVMEVSVQISEEKEKIQEDTNKWDKVQHMLAEIWGTDPSLVLVKVEGGMEQAHEGT
ncbi:stage III sporulation protein AF [Mangrovibacillus cuniculi]|uniref:Stage III sporulation protein AF n=1 Tax=Mangrovibacillus cuniculi TaxID=2593652 RepID=A0A7S8CBB5_9BACI|nr:stage III sporulation protein AF [Mangrovibacillus cuniculi]QPC46830.1 stage III sporulation protein AF [Mangrovibacillus cuniculi]